MGKEAVNPIGLRCDIEISARFAICSRIVLSPKNSGLRFLILFLAVDLICSPIAHKIHRLIHTMHTSYIRYGQMQNRGLLGYKSAMCA